MVVGEERGEGGGGGGGEREEGGGGGGGRKGIDLLFLRVGRFVRILRRECWF